MNMGCFNASGMGLHAKVISHVPSEEAHEFLPVTWAEDHAATRCHAMAYLDLEIGCRLGFWGCQRPTLVAKFL